MVRFGLTATLWRCSARLPAATAFLAIRDRLEPARSGHGRGGAGHIAAGAKSSSPLTESGHPNALAHRSQSCGQLPEAAMRWKRPSVMGRDLSSTFPHDEMTSCRNGGEVLDRSLAGYPFLLGHAFCDCVKVGPRRDDASVRSQRSGCHIMPSPNAVPECPSLQRARATSARLKCAYGIFGDRVPVGTSVSPRFQAQPEHPPCRLRVIGELGRLRSRYGGGLGSRKAERGAISPHAVQDHTDAARQSNSCTPLPAPLGNIQRPCG